MRIEIIIINISILTHYFFNSLFFSIDNFLIRLIAGFPYIKLFNKFKSACIIKIFLKMP